MTDLHARRLLTFARAGLALAAVLALTTGCNLHFGTGIEARDAWLQTYTVKPGATLVVHETNGKVHVTATDGDRIEVSATKVTKAPSEDAAKQMLKEFNISENATADRVELDGTAQSLNLGFGRSRWVEYEIKVPRSAAVTIKTTNSEVSANGIGGFFRVETVNGRIAADGLGDGADVSAINGAVDLAFSKVAESGIRCKTTNGQIIITIPQSSKARITGSVMNGVIHTEHLQVQATDESRRRLDATVGGGGPEIRLESTNGEVRVVGR